MRRALNELHGIVLKERNGKFVIALKRGGTAIAPITEGIKVGSEVVFFTDALEKEITSIMLKEVADDIVQRGSDPFCDVMDTEPPPYFIEEEDDGIDYATLCKCPDAE